MVFDAPNSKSGNGAFVVNERLTDGAYIDGMSNTLAFSEIKAYQANVKPGIPNGPNAPLPTSTSQVVGYAASATVSQTGHTEWVDGKTHETGFTAVFTPNTEVLLNTGGASYDIDLISRSENTANSIPTYAAVTSRSYHPGVVQSALVDGSVRSTSETVDLSVWRGMASRNGGEAVQLP